MLSLSPRFDLFAFKLPKDFLPEPIEAKYSKILSREKSVSNKPIDYLNESIQAVTIPGISNLTVEQDQISTHPSPLKAVKPGQNIDVEPAHKNTTYRADNPLSQITNEFTVTFRQNQGLYNYWMLYETIFYKILKQFRDKYKDGVFYLDILDEKGVPTTRVKFLDVYIDGIDGLTFSYNKTERSVETFDLKFKFNNIDIDFLPTMKEEEETQKEE